MKPRFLFLIAMTVVMAGLASDVRAATFRVAHYRWRNDDGNEARATWRSDTDMPAVFATNMNIRLRLCLQPYTNAQTDQAAVMLQYATSDTADIGTVSVGEPWVIVRSSYTTQAFVMASSPWFADGDGTTDQLAGTGTFRPGYMVEAPSYSTPTTTVQGNERSNIEFCFRATPNAEMNKLYRFRLVTRGGSEDQDGLTMNPPTGYLLKLIPVEPLGDVNGDGVVNEADLSLVVTNFGRDYR